MLFSNGDVEITAESIDWIIYGIKAMDYHYFVKIPRWLKGKAESSREELQKELRLHGIDFKDLVVEMRKYKGRNYRAEIETKGYETKNYSPKSTEQIKKAKAESNQSKLF